MAMIPAPSLAAGCISSPAWKGGLGIPMHIMPGMLNGIGHSESLKWAFDRPHLHLHPCSTRKRARGGAGGGVGYGMGL